MGLDGMQCCRTYSTKLFPHQCVESESSHLIHDKSASVVTCKRVNGVAKAYILLVNDSPLSDAINDGTDETFDMLFFILLLLL